MSSPRMTHGQTLIPQLQAYIDQFSALKQNAAELAAGLSEQQFNQKPAPERWSAAQCIDHLNVAGFELLPNLEAAIERGRDEEIYGEPPFRYGLFSKMFIRFNDPSFKLKMKTFKVYKPSGNPSLKKETVIARFEQLQDDFVEQVRASNGLDLKRIKAPSPVSGLMRFSLGAWFAATVAHERRHLQQAREA